MVILNFRKLENAMPSEQMARAKRRLKDAQVNASKSVGVLISLGEAIIDGRVEAEILQLQEEILHLVGTKKDQRYVHNLSLILWFTRQVCKDSI